MASAAPDLLSPDRLGGWVRLRTLIVLRWMAIAGQATAIAVAHSVYGVQLPLGPCLLVVGLSVVANLVAIFVFPGTTRLTERQAFGMLLFDLVQLGLLLFLTGGVTNPFALLMLAPVTIAATALNLRSTVALAAAAIVIITLTAWANLPLRYADGTVIRLPPLFAFGFWLSIVIGVVFIGVYARRVATEIRSMSDALLATQMALAREQKLTALGGVVAAAAHELGTPLATIKLASAELMEELEDRPDLREDAALIRDQADRCRDILRSMGRAGKDDRQLHSVPLGALLREAAEPHARRGKTLAFTLSPGPGGSAQEPTVRRSPEVLHGLRNLVQNAVDFARGRVWIDAEWTPGRITIRIADDGDGYPPQILSRIGDPFVRRRRGGDEVLRPGYEGMGLGLFIAKTLLERSGAELAFANGSDPFLPAEEQPARSGAVVAAVWPADRLSVGRDAALGANDPFLP